MTREERDEAIRRLREVNRLTRYERGQIEDMYGDDPEPGMVEEFLLTEMLRRYRSDLERIRLRRA